MRLLALMCLLAIKVNEVWTNPMLHGQRQPVIFEPRTQITPTGGTYDMILMYDLRTTTDAVAEAQGIVNRCLENTNNYVMRQQKGGAMSSIPIPVDLRAPNRGRRGATVNRP